MIVSPEVLDISDLGVHLHRNGGGTPASYR